MKRLLTKADIHQVAKFAQNHQTLKQIDEELENEPSVSEEKDESEENERNEQNEEDDADGQQELHSNEDLNETGMQLLNIRSITQNNNNNSY